MPLHGSCSGKKLFAHCIPERIWGSWILKMFLFPQIFISFLPREKKAKIGKLNFTFLCSAFIKPCDGICWCKSSNTRSKPFERVLIKPIWFGQWQERRSSFSNLFRILIWIPSHCHCIRYVRFETQISLCFLLVFSSARPQRISIIKYFFHHSSGDIFIPRWSGIEFPQNWTPWGDEGEFVYV